MAFKSVIVFLVASLNVYALAQPITFLRDSGLQNSFVTPYQSVFPVNYINSGLVYPYASSYGSSNIINNVNSVSSLGYPSVLSPSYVSSGFYSPISTIGSPLGYSTNQNLNQQLAPVQVNF